MKNVKRRAVFLDRDGTINRLVYYEDHGFVDSPFAPSQVKLIPGAARAMKMLKKKGFLLVMASNQPGIAKGNISRKAFAAIGFLQGKAWHSTRNISAPTTRTQSLRPTAKSAHAESQSQACSCRLRRSTAST